MGDCNFQPHLHLLKAISFPKLNLKFEVKKMRHIIPCLTWSIVAQIAIIVNALNYYNLSSCLYTSKYFSRNIFIKKERFSIAATNRHVSFFFFECIKSIRVISGERGFYFPTALKCDIFTGLPAGPLLRTEFANPHSRLPRYCNMRGLKELKNTNILRDNWWKWWLFYKT